MHQTAGVYVTKEAPYRALAVQLSDADPADPQAKVVILDATCRVNGRYPVLATMVMPFAMFHGLACGLGQSLASMVASGLDDVELPSVCAVIDGLKEARAVLDAQNPQNPGENHG